MKRVNILILMAGNNIFFKEREYQFPIPLVEINSKTMIELVFDNLNTIALDKNFIFVVNESDCKKYHLDDTLRILTENKATIIKLESDTKGAACSALMAIEHIDLNEPLIVANPDQIFDINLQDVITNFSDCDAGVIIFDSIHPRWSYVRLDENEKIIETAEKKPISRNAIAGFLYFGKGEFLMEYSMSMIRKDANVNGIFYISSILNDMVLDNKNLAIYRLENDKYHTFYSPHKIKEYEDLS